MTEAGRRNPPEAEQRYKMALMFKAGICKADIAKMCETFSKTMNWIFYIPYTLLIRTRGCPFWDSLLLLSLNKRLTTPKGAANTTLGVFLAKINTLLLRN